MNLYRKGIMASLLVLVLTSAAPARAALQATADRTELLPGETITLTLRQDEPGAVREPDLRALEENFQILDVRRSQQVTIVNGTRSEIMEWVVVLLPNNADVSRIPPIRAGTQTTQPIAISTVAPARQGQQERPALFVEAELEESEGVVGSEIIYTVRVYDQGNMQSGTLRPPEIPGAAIESSGESSNRQVILDGQRYSLHEQRFRITPETSGTLEIPPTILDARMQPEPEANPRRSRSFFGGFFDRAQAGPLRRVASNPITLEVGARPTTTEGWFLPAKVVRLEEVWSAESGELHPGEALTRTVSLRVLGATSEQLPAFVIPKPDGARQYAEGTREGTRPTDQGTISVREETVTIIPSQAGTLEFPAVEVKWFDVDTKTPRIASIPARTFEVLPAAGQSREIQPEAGMPAVMPEAAELATPATPNLAQRDWRTVSGIAAILAIVALAGLGAGRLRRRRRDAEPSLSLRARRVLAACRNSDPQNARQAILQWAEAALPEPFTPTLVDIGNRLDNPTLVVALHELDQCLYGRESSPWSGEKLAAAFRPLARGHRSARPSTSTTPLPALYPSP